MIIYVGHSGEEKLVNSEFSVLFIPFLKGAIICGLWTTERDSSVQVQAEPESFL